MREVTDTSGNVVARYDYDPYGRVTKVSGSVDSDFLYTGHYYHAPSGLHLAMYRAYDSESGRWLNRDPIGEEGGINLYGYVGNDPANAIDPDGLSVYSFLLRVFTRGGRLVSQIRELQKRKAVEKLKKALDEAGDGAVVQAQDKETRDAVGKALDPDGKLRRNSRTGNCEEKHPGYPPHVHPNSGPYGSTHVQTDPPGTTYTSLIGAGLLSILAPKTAEASQTPEADGWYYFYAVSWDAVSNVDPTFTSDVAEIIYGD